MQQQQIYGAYPVYQQYNNAGAGFYGNAFPAQGQGMIPRGRGRGMGGFQGNPGGFGGRGGYNGYQQQGMNPYMQQGYGRGGAAFGMRARRKKPFVGGSLETQREWERNTLCCFHLQGHCKFQEGCRFAHEDDGERKCQFGDQCRVGHNARGAAPGAEQPKDEKTTN
eukprot:TRINITY_DN8651_c0_g1_i1.p2 TRINITY_DN8651_c0_g1~~TRINITY_DN8651_c0_g1_i1.p2  ORF type:complete len:166 (+),score=38.51 TRINITY_DN8651_c0_g1_i1:117-614(+)